MISAGCAGPTRGSYTSCQTSRGAVRTGQARARSHDGRRAASRRSRRRCGEQALGADGHTPADGTAAASSSGILAAAIAVASLPPCPAPPPRSGRRAFILVTSSRTELPEFDETQLRCSSQQPEVRAHVRLDERHLRREGACRGGSLRPQPLRELLRLRVTAPESRARGARRRRRR